ncbi:unnamed protein product [Allacma fusca]|uniref:ADP-ribosylation factor-like protein 16 n=1 Tax=Allacma fusca TaxID=39272 RepID=A0A8J2NTD3_9HEXA|nr:unnamed protein product [Allacma fusca]
MACLCLGPISSGKTLLLRRLQNSAVDETTPTVETVGTNIVQVPKKAPAKSEKEKKRKGWDERDTIGLREVGGSMAPLWASYYSPGKPIIYTIDSSNLFQVSIATVLLMEMLAHEKLVGSKFLIVLAKSDLTNRKKLNYLKFMMRLDNIASQAGSRITIEEASALTGNGVENIRKWIVENCDCDEYGASKNN